MYKADTGAGSKPLPTKIALPRFVLHLNSVRQAPVAATCTNLAQAAQESVFTPCGLSGRYL